MKVSFQPSDFIYSDTAVNAARGTNGETPSHHIPFWIVRTLTASWATIDNGQGTVRRAHHFQTSGIGSDHSPELPATKKPTAFTGRMLNVEMPQCLISPNGYM
jgi:hypothetical protein